MKKSIAVIYGVVAYILFLVAFLYAVGFVGNFIVPKSIDSEAETTFMQAFVVNTLLLGIFAILHSVMARPAFKKWWTRIIYPAIERSTYVLISSLALLLIYWQWQPITSVVWKTDNKTAAMLLTGVYFLGWLIAFLSTFMINHFELFGLKQIFENLRNKQSPSLTFRTNLLYRIVRHPIMLGYIIAFWATPLMTMGHLIFSITTTLYIFIAVKFYEEKDLRKSLGNEYEDYQKKVPMIFPFTGK